MAEAAHGDAEEHHLSPWPVFVGIGIPLALAGTLWLPWGVIPGLVVFGIGMGGWVHTDMRGWSTSWIGDTEEARDFGLGDVTIRKLGLWLFLSTEVMFFSGLMGTSWSLRMQAGHWAAPGEILAINVTAVNTFILIVSSFAIVKALEHAHRGNQVKMRRFLVATLLLGITFLSIQVVEYLELIHEGLLPWAAPHGLPAAYGATFYAQTGFHGAHVTAGVIGLAYLVRKAYNGRLTEKNHEAIELVGLYWHFVDVVWIFLFTVVYLI